MKYMSACLALILGVPASATVHDLTVAEQRLEVVPGRVDRVVAINGTVPGPVLRLKEGEEAVVRVTNRLKQPTSIHWHGILLPGDQDGSAGFNGFRGIAPGETFTYRFRVRQNGTYWYHAHGLEEQAGQYAALVIDPAGPDPIKADREHVLLLSDHHRDAPQRILNNLKGDAGYYNQDKRTLPEFLRDAGKFGLGAALKDRAAWNGMRMDATDIADVAGYALLVNGKPTAAKPWLAFRPGERVRLRLVNGSAMSFMDVRIPGLPMTVVAADGKRVEPVTVDELRMGVAETYDVIVEPKDDRAHALWVETIDRRASVLASLAPREGMMAEAPAPRPRPILLASEMGHGDATPAKALPAPMTTGAGAGAACTPEHAAMGHCTLAPARPAADPTCPPEHAAMGHCTPKAAPAAPAADPGCPPEHAAMGHCTPKPAAPAPAADPACPPEHAAMGHCTPKAAPQPGPRAGTAVALAARPAGGTPFPVVDYGYGSVDHSTMDHGATPWREGDTDGSGRVFGWASGAPYGARVLSMRDLVSAEPQRDARPPSREIVVRITGNMERYIWTLNGRKFGEAPPIRVTHGERVRITFVNETMMAHPMHLHGMFFEVENGQPLDRLPSKTVIAVAPGRTQSILLTANEAGEWPLHCHLLYHMASGMMQKLVVASVDNPDGTPAAPHAGHQH